MTSRRCSLLGEGLFSTMLASVHQWRSQGYFGGEGSVGCRDGREKCVCVCVCMWGAQNNYLLYLLLGLHRSHRVLCIRHCFLFVAKPDICIRLYSKRKKKKKRNGRCWFVCLQMGTWSEQFSGLKCVGGLVRGRLRFSVLFERVWGSAALRHLSS